jgi:hypothetical protein
MGIKKCDRQFMVCSGDRGKGLGARDYGAGKAGGASVSGGREVVQGRSKSEVKNRANGIRPYRSK